MSFTMLGASVAAAAESPAASRRPQASDSGPAPPGVCYFTYICSWRDFVVISIAVSQHCARAGKIIMTYGHFTKCVTMSPL